VDTDLIVAMMLDSIGEMYSHLSASCALTLSGPSSNRQCRTLPPLGCSPAGRFPLPFLRHSDIFPMHCHVKCLSNVVRLLC